MHNWLSDLYDIPYKRIWNYIVIIFYIIIIIDIIEIIYR